MNGPKNGAARLLERFKKPQKMVENPMPKVAICVPSGDMVHAQFSHCLYQLGVFNGAVNGMAPIPTALIGVQGSLIVRNRNECIEHAQRLGVDYVLFLDTDMVFPGYVLRRLLSHEKDIVGCTYRQRNEPRKVLGVWPDGMVLSTDKLHEVNALPGGCMLIKLSVFAEMTKPYYRTPAIEADEQGPARIQGEDYYFCDQADRLGFQVWLDAGLSMELGHVGSEIVRIEVQPQMVMEPVAAANEEVSDGQASVH
jgi:hypothetical protein